MNVRLTILAIAPTVAIGLAIYLNDRYDREPISLLLKTFVYGMLSIFPVFIFEKLLLYFNFFSGYGAAFYTSFIVAGLVEEYFKREVVLRTAFNSPSFNEKLDGIVYSVFAALGFATVENIGYVLFHYSSNYYVAIYRGIFSVPAHALLAVTMGYYLSLSKYAPHPKEKAQFLRKALMVPMLLHGIFDFILLSRIPILMMLFVPYVIYLWIVNLKKLNKYTKASREGKKLL